MRVIIFGASGSIGKPLVLQALGLDYEVTAFVRDGQALGHIRHSKLQTFTGDALDQQSVMQAIEGHDAVLCVLGAGRNGIVRSRGTRHIIKGMEQHGVRRLICQSTLGAGDSYDNLNFFWKHVMFGWYLRAAYLDHQLQEEYVMNSGLDWTLVRPGAFTDGPVTGNFRHGFATNDRSVKLKISRADVAMFLLMQLETSQYLRKAPGISY